MKSSCDEIVGNLNFFHGFYGVLKYKTCIEFSFNVKRGLTHYLIC